MRLRLLLRLLVALLLLVGAWWQTREARRLDLPNLQSRTEVVAGPLDAAHSLGQTFTSTRARLSALQFYATLLSTAPSPAALTLHLRTAISDTRDLAQARVPLSDLRDEPQFTFSFPPQADSEGKSYYVLVETDAPPSTVSLWASSDEVLPGGSLNVDGEPQPRDLDLVVLDDADVSDLASDLWAGAREYGFLLLLTLAYGLVGLAAVSVLGGLEPHGLAHNWTLGVAAGLAMVCLFFWLAALVHLSLGPGPILLASIIALLASAILLVCTRAWDRLRPTGPDLLLAALMLLALAVRVLQVQGLAAPLWVDGLAHQNRVAAIVAQGGLPSDLLYHTGFHSQVAFWYWLTGFNSPYLLLWLGQWASVLTGLGAYVLARQLTRHSPSASAEAAALLSAAVVWFLAPLPAYLITWSRFPFSLALALLPVTLAVSVDALFGQGSRALAALLLSGQVLVHYGTLSFWFTFLLSYGLYTAWQTRPRRGEIMRWVRGVIWVVAPMMVLLAARLLPLWLSPRLGTLARQSEAIAEGIDPVYLLQLTLKHAGAWVWVTALLGLVLAFLVDRRLPILLASWLAVQAILTQLLAPLFGNILANETNLILALPLLLALLVGAVAKWLFSPEGNAVEVAPVGRFGGTTQMKWLGVIGLFILSLLGGRSLVGIVNPVTIQFTPADSAALQWIQEHTAPGARFMVNAFNWANLRYLPSDGGSWIPAFTGRHVVYPQRSDQVSGAADWARAQGVDYIYFGRSGGDVSREPFSRAPDLFAPVYSQAGVEIYKVR